LAVLSKIKSQKWQRGIFGRGCLFGVKTLKKLSQGHFFRLPFFFFYLNQSREIVFDNPIVNSHGKFKCAVPWARSYPLAFA
jgi:hypothetical protein